METGAIMGFAGSSIHIRDVDQNQVERVLTEELTAGGLTATCRCCVDKLPASELDQFRQSHTRSFFSDKPHSKRRDRSFLITPRLGRWVSVFERGEHHDLALAQALSVRLSAYSAATLWEEHGGEQEFRGYAEGELVDSFVNDADDRVVQRSGSLADATSEEFVLEHYVHDDLEIAVGYGMCFCDVLLYREVWEERCPLSDILYIRFRR